MPIICQIIASLLAELGFEKVVGLLDGNRTDLVTDLSDQFPQYQFYAMAADDIRTKKEQSLRPPVVGILDETGKVRVEHEKHMRELLNSVNEDL